MEVQIKKLPQSAVELTIEASIDELKPFEQRALTRLASKLELPGFRPGKVPATMARKHLDPIKILEETVNLAVPELYASAVKQHKLEVVGAPKVDLLKFAPGNPLSFKAVAAVLPEIKLPDYHKLRITHKKVEVSEEQLDRLLRMLQRDRAQEKPVERAAQKGDAVEIDFAITQKKVPLEHGQGIKHPLILGDGFFIPGFEDQLVGLKASQEKDFVVIFPKNYGKKSLAGQTADVHVKLHSVKERILPALDDEFAKGLGTFKTMAELRTKLRENLKVEADYKEQDRFESEMLSRLAGMIQLEIPDVLLQGELNKMAGELESSLVHQGANFKDYLSSINKSLEELKKGWVEQAKKRVTIGLLIRTIARAEGIKVSDKEVDNEANTTLKQNPGNKEVERTVKSQAYRDYIAEIIRNRKTIKLLSSLVVGDTKPDQG
ncbi:MAG: trigger factor [Parcubacteria group bacterium]